MSREEARERALGKLGEAVNRCREYCRREIASGFERMVAEARAGLPSAPLGTKPDMARVNDFLAKYVNRWSEGLPSLRDKFAGEFEDMILMANVELLDLDNLSEIAADISFDAAGPEQTYETAGFDPRAFWLKVAADASGSAHPLALDGDYKETAALALADAYLRQPFALHVVMQTGLLWPAPVLFTGLSTWGIFGNWKEKLVLKVGERLSDLPQQMASTFDGLDYEFFGKLKTALKDAANALSDGRAVLPAAEPLEEAALEGLKASAAVFSPLAAACVARADTLARVETLTERLASIALRLGLESTVYPLREATAELKEDTFRLIALGGYQSGKSSLLNAFLACPSAGADQPHEGGGVVESGTPSKIARHITLRDTPALDTEPERAAPAFEAAKGFDAAFVMIRSDAVPVVREMGFMRELRDRDVKIFWVINRIRGRAIDEHYKGFLWQRLVHETLGGPRRNGDSDGFDFDSHDIFFVDACGAASGRAAGDERAVEESGVVRLEERVAAYLTGERLKKRAGAWLGLALKAAADFAEEAERRMTIAASEEKALREKCDLTRGLILESSVPDAELIIDQVLGNWRRTIDAHAGARQELNSLREEIRRLSAEADATGTGLSPAAAAV